MSKDELINCICEINKSASAEFLSGFSEEELNEYLEHLMELDLEELVLMG
jgi:helix-turn-helix protein